MWKIKENIFFDYENMELVKFEKDKEIKRVIIPYPATAMEIERQSRKI